jgi:hypothetical protein
MKFRMFHFPPTATKSAGKRVVVVVVVVVVPSCVCNDLRQKKEE